jgi:nucleoside-diphosphate-sugar epimerase
VKEASVLVTGGAGFIGSHLVDALLDRGSRVRVLDDLSTGKRENVDRLAGRIEFLEGDIRDAAACRRACAGIRYVFHQAALGSVPRSMKDPATTIAVNVAGTANIFAASRDEGVESVVYASSSSVYGDSDRLPKKEGEEGRPLSPYALSKAMNEELAECFARTFAMKIVGLRYFNVYGPRQSPGGPYAAVIPRFLQAISEGRPLTIYGDGEQRRDFTFVHDAVAANLAGILAPPAAVGRAYNIGYGSETSVLNLAKKMCESAGVAPVLAYEPPRAGDVVASRADVSRAERELGFRARTAIDDGLRMTVEAALG